MGSLLLNLDVNRLQKGEYMANMSNYLEDKILKAELANAYLALYRTNPGEDDTGVEVGSTGYNRQKVDFTSTGAGSVQNSTSIAFESIEDGYGNVTHVGVRDAQYGGNLLFYKALSTPVFSEKGGSIKIDVGGLKISLD